MAKGEKEENPVCLCHFMACNRIPAEQEILDGEEKQKKTGMGRKVFLDMERGKNCWLTHGVGELKASVICSQEVCTLSLGITEKQDRMNNHFAEQMLKISSGISITLTQS